MRTTVRLGDEDGQSIILVALAMSLFLIGAVGLGVDGAHIYAQRQMAQSAADAAAVAGIMSIFDGTNGSGSTAFGTGSSFTCSTSDARTPCAYALKNGFGGLSSDTVKVDFPSDTAAPGVNFSGSDAVNLIRVTVTRNVSTFLMRMIGASVATVQATAMAGIVDVVAPVPILVTHPRLLGSFSTNGGVLVTICGGPSRSVQVNSGSGSAVTTAGSGTVDLSKAGPPDPGDCSSGTGADFGTWGGPASAPFTFMGGSTGHYLEASPIQDPLAGVAAPTKPTNSGTMGTHAALANGTNGCPASPQKACQLYYPGLYPTGINGDNSTPVFMPGIYYIQSGGMVCRNNCSMYMATGQTDGASGTNTGWTGNMLVYNTGTGNFNLGANGTIQLVGSPTSSAYKGILFFEDHAAPANTSAQKPKNAHSLGGGGALSLKGTIYLTNSLGTMNADPTHYQELDLQGTPGSVTHIDGEIIVGALSLGGNAGITMNLNSTATLMVRQVAMVN